MAAREQRVKGREEVTGTMFWYDHGAGAWGWFAMSISMVLFWAVIIGAGVLLYRALTKALTNPRRTDGRPTPAHSPEQLLAERFARGEIDEEEYRRRLATLRDASVPTSGSRPPGRG